MANIGDEHKTIKIVPLRCPIGDCHMYYLPEDGLAHMLDKHLAHTPTQLLVANDGERSVLLFKPDELLLGDVTLLGLMLYGGHRGEDDLPGSTGMCPVNRISPGPLEIYNKHMAVIILTWTSRIVSEKSRMWYIWAMSVGSTKSPLSITMTAYNCQMNQSRGAIRYVYNNTPLSRKISKYSMGKHSLKLTQGDMELLMDPSTGTVCLDLILHAQMQRAGGPISIKSTNKTTTRNH